MAFYQFSTFQDLPVSMEEVWDFISSPHNLKDITPRRMRFEIRSPYKGKIYEGMILTYRVSPIRGFRTNWVTEITHMREGHFFVDEQRIGPYGLWHHQHELCAIDYGTRMTDIITYAPPFGIFGRFANTLFIKKTLQNIFEYRRTALEERFGTYKPI